MQRTLKMGQKGSKLDLKMGQRTEQIPQLRCIQMANNHKKEAPNHTPLGKGNSK